MELAVVKEALGDRPEGRFVDPPFKWVGGKRQLLPVLVPLIGTVKGNYFEPMVGGGALFFALAGAGKLQGGAILGDTNRELYAVYQALSSPHAFREMMGHLHAAATNYLAAPNPEDFYYGMRAHDVSDSGLFPSWASIAARFLFLNRAGSNGLYRVNSKGEFNVPWGKDPTVKIVHEDLLYGAHDLMVKVSPHRTNESVFGFMAAMLRRSAIEPDDVIYLDPPYIPASDTANFTSYSKMPFGQKQQEELAQLFRDLAMTGARVLLSNSDTPEARRLYEGFEIVEVKATRRINSAASKRGKVGEILVLGNIQR